MLIVCSQLLISQVISQVDSHYGARALKSYAAPPGFRYVGMYVLYIYTCQLYILSTALSPPFGCILLTIVHVYYYLHTVPTYVCKLDTYMHETYAEATQLCASYLLSLLYTLIQVQ
ncbi:hypothetical protein GGR54DRAFT_610807 [Hypoxylon sp. NC1633]|nr:hypothetical protein GGR54DRAFT_610807 [Hypoxylon sp. NC1633]